MILRHYGMMLEDKPEKIAIREMRKHIGWYLHGMRGASKVRDEINRCSDWEKTIALLEDFFEE